MDRALDPELIRLSLGNHENLPSAEIVAQMLAEAELALLLHKPEVPESLVAIGWYLHAVASSKYALRAYGVNRQRRAFQVSGHIFDLLLQMPQSNTTDKMKYCFACQIAYLRGQLNPNATAIYRREFLGKLTYPRLIESSQEVSLACGVALLGFDIQYVYQVTLALQRETAELVAKWGVEDILSTPFASASGVATGVYDLATFLVYGNPQALDRARYIFTRAISAEACLDDQVSRWVAAHLLNLSDDLRNASVWTVLPPDVPIGVKRAFIISQPKVMTLWPPQLDLLKTADEPTNNLFSANSKRAFLSTPTSGGKTLIAQLLVASHLATQDTSVCYIAPTRSLCREVDNTLKSRLRYIGFVAVDGLPEGEWLEDQQTVESRVEVMTPERLSYLIRSDSTRVLERYGMFIFDEVHSIGETGRGWILEEVLSYLHYATQDKPHRIVLMSAAIGNRLHFAQWMSGREDGKGIVLFHSDWRGPRQLHAICSTETDWQQPREEITRSAQFPKRVRYPLFTSLYVRVSHTEKIRSLRTIEPVGTLALKYTPDNRPMKDKNNTTPFYRMLVPIIRHLSASGPVLVIQPTRQTTVLMAKAIAESQVLSNQQENQALVDLIEARLSDAHPLSEVIKKGVAYHHGSLPSEIREAIEEAMTQGNLKFLVATTTMTEGINLPVRSVFVASQGSHTQEGYKEYITGSKLINAIGRAGRATKETEGVVVLARPERPKSSDFDRFKPTDSDIKVESMLATEEALNTLAEFESLRLTTEDEVFEKATPLIDQFLSFVWFVASQLEALEKAVSVDEVKEVLSKTLAWVQLTDEGKDRWTAAAGLTLSIYDKTNTSSRRRWAKVGTSLSSARKIETIAAELANILEDIDVPQEPLEAIELLMHDGRLERILQLREAPKIKVYTQRGGQREQIEIPVDKMLRQWIHGAELVTLAQTYFKDVADTEFKFEQLGDFTSEYFETFLPWIFGITIEWTNSLLKEKNVDKTLPDTIPGVVRWGVANSTAVNLMVQGVRSRRLATKMTDVWQAEERKDDIRSWVRSMNVAQWRDTFEASVTELRNLLEFSRNKVKGAAADLIMRESATLEVESAINDSTESDVSLIPIDDSEFSPIGIWSENQLLGQVFGKDQADLQSILDSGLVVTAKFSATSGKGLLTLKLVDPNTQLQ